MGYTTNHDWSHECAWHFIKYPKKVSENLSNPVVASVFPALSMGIMLMATYIKPLVPSLAFIIWIIGLILHIVLILFFTKKHVLDFNIKKVFPSWFIVYVGIVVGSVTAPGSLCLAGYMSSYKQN